VVELLLADGRVNISCLGYKAVREAIQNAHLDVLRILFRECIIFESPNIFLTLTRW
jgi:hypothetical protein